MSCNLATVNCALAGSETCRQVCCNNPSKIDTILDTVCRSNTFSRDAVRWAIETGLVEANADAIGGRYDEIVAKFRASQFQFAEYKMYEQRQQRPCQGGHYVGEANRRGLTDGDWKLVIHIIELACDSLYRERLAQFKEDPLARLAYRFRKQAYVESAKLIVESRY